MRYALLILGASATAGVAFVGTGGDAVRLSPGLWTYDAKVEKLEATGVAGASPEALQAGLFGKALRLDREACVSAEEAAKPVSLADLRIADFGEGECTYARTNLSGGKVDVAGTCVSAADGGQREFSLTGTFAAETMDLLLTFDDSVPAHGARIQSALRITGRRTGACDPAQAKPWYVDDGSASQAAVTDIPGGASEAEMARATEEARNALAAAGY